MKKALFFLCLLCAGCGGNVRKDTLADALKLDPYEFLARKLSDAKEGAVNRKVAVLPFSYTDKRDSDDGVVVSERLLTRMIQEGKFEMVERNLLEKVMGELKLQNSGTVDETSIRKLGKILGVEAVVTGTLTRQPGARIEINARLIKAETAVILAAAAVVVPSDWETFLAGTEGSAPAAVPAAAPAVSAQEMAGFPKDWKYRENLRVAEKSGASLADYQLLVRLDSAAPIRLGRMKPDCSDLRFANSNESAKLNYWIEAGCNTAETRVWVRLPFLAKNSVKNVYMYYGNPSAAGESSGDGVFQVFDDFSDNSLDFSKWSVIRGQCPLAERNGRLEITACTDGNAAGIDWLMTVKKISPPYILEFNGRAPASGSSGQFHSVALRWNGSACGLYNNPAGATEICFADGITPSAHPLLMWHDPACGQGKIAEGGGYVAPDAWHKFRITDDAEAISFYSDESLVFKGRPLFSGGEHIAMRGRNAPSGYAVYYDDVRVRNYAFPEPVVSLYRAKAGRYSGGLYSLR
jgi:TolB-like protein